MDIREHVAMAPVGFFAQPLAGQSAVVTGANSGIGKATALALAQLGADRRVELLEAGEDALERVLTKLGRDAVVVTNRTELEGLLRAET